MNEIGTVGGSPKAFVYVNVDRTFWENGSAERFVKGSKPTTAAWSKSKFNLEKGESVLIEFDVSVYCTSFACSCANKVTAIVSWEYNGKFISNQVITSGSVGTLHTFTVNTNTRRVYLRNDGDSAAEISNFLWTGRLPNN